MNRRPGYFWKSFASDLLNFHHKIPANFQSDRLLLVGSHCALNRYVVRAALAVNRRFMLPSIRDQGRSHTTKMASLPTFVTSDRPKGLT